MKRLGERGVFNSEKRRLRRKSDSSLQILEKLPRGKGRATLLSRAGLDYNSEKTPELSEELGSEISCSGKQ